MMEDKLLDIAASGSSAARADRIGMAKLAKLAFDGRDLRHRINKINVLREFQATAYKQRYNAGQPMALKRARKPLSQTERKSCGPVMRSPRRSLVA
jgi:hypothetical protein